MSDNALYQPAPIKRIRARIFADWVAPAVGGLFLAAGVVGVLLFLQGPI